MELITKEELQAKIFTIRGVQVMMDKDLAMFYEIKPIRLREQLKRNPERFPLDFTFQLSDSEVEMLVSQNAIASKSQLGGSNPFVFTEQGVAALSGVLKSEKANQISIAIFRAFVKMRHSLNQTNDFLERLMNVEKAQIQFDNRLDELLNALYPELLKPSKGIFFEGQLFDAYVFATELIKNAKSSIILIDNYIDETTLLMLSKRNPNCNAVIYCNRMNAQLQLDLRKHNEQYPTIEIKSLRSSHDRFIIIDNQDLFHIGASLKDLGKKWFAFSKINEFLPEIISRL